MNKIALVTGTSTGLGLHLSLQLAKAGYRVYATMRNLDKQQALADAVAAQDVPVTIKQLDVQSTESVEQCVADIIAEHGQIDLLVNNAGAGYVKTTENSSEEEIEWVLDVNFKGVVRCTKAVLPHMRQARSGHIVNISSIGGLVGQPFNDFYCAAKFAVEGYTECLASYVQPSFGVKFTTVQPGGIHTEFANSVLAQFMGTGGIQEDEYKPVLEQYIGAAQARASGGDSELYQTAEQVAEVVVDCVQQDNPPLRLRTSNWGEQFCHYKTQGDPDGTLQRDKVTQQFLQP